MGVATPGGLGGSTGAWQLIHPTRTYLYLLDSQSGCRCTERLRLIMCGNVGVQAPIESNMRQPMDRSKPPLVHSFVCRATIPRLLSWGSNGIDTYVDISIALPKAKIQSSSTPDLSCCILHFPSLLCHYSHCYQPRIWVPICRLQGGPPLPSKVMILFLNNKQPTMSLI